MKRKLSLNKQTITNLTRDQIDSIYGGWSGPEAKTFSRWDENGGYLGCAKGTIGNSCTPGDI